jgi:hypothetical protein
MSKKRIAEVKKDIADIKDVMASYRRVLQNEDDKDHAQGVREGLSRGNALLGTLRRELRELGGK